ncbi:MAG: acyl carrier protein [Dehalococcoidia bacterium]|jgi:acyl carrier protein
MSTLEHLREIMTKVARCNGDEIGLDTALRDVEADSLHWLQIIIRVESDFDIEIDFEKMAELTTIGHFVSYIDSCRA